MHERRQMNHFEHGGDGDVLPGDSAAGLRREQSERRAQHFAAVFADVLADLREERQITLQLLVEELFDRAQMLCDRGVNVVQRQDRRFHGIPS